jgi:hypothetical protein
VALELRISEGIGCRFAVHEAGEGWASLNPGGT